MPMAINQRVTKLKAIFEIISFEGDKDKLFFELVTGISQLALAKTAREYPTVASQLEKIDLAAIQSGDAQLPVNTMSEIFRTPAGEYFENQFHQAVDEYLKKLLPTLPANIGDEVTSIWQSAE